MTMFKNDCISKDNCLECGSDLEQTNSTIGIFRCNNNLCGQLWKKSNGRLLKVEKDDTEGIMRKANKEIKRLYKEYKRKFHLDFIPELVCNEFDCIKDEKKFCATVGCPIIKLKNELLNLKLIPESDDIDLEDSMAVKNNIKTKWDYLATGGLEIKKLNVKFKIVYFNVDEGNKKSVIQEPFPRNRFDSDYEAYDFLDNFCKKSGENPEDYYIAKVRVDKLNKPKKKLSKRRDLEYIDRPTQKELKEYTNEAIRDSNKMTEEQVTNEVLMLTYKGKDKTYHDMKDELISNHMLNESMKEDFLEESC